MDTNDTPIKTTPVHHDHPHLRKLARALIAIAREELAREAEAERRLRDVAEETANRKPGEAA